MTITDERSCLRYTCTVHLMQLASHHKFLDVPNEHITWSTPTLIQYNDIISSSSLPQSESWRYSHSEHEFTVTLRPCIYTYAFPTCSYRRSVLQQGNMNATDTCTFIQRMPAEVNYICLLGVVPNSLPDL